MCTENLDPDVLVMEASEDGRRYNGTHVLDGTMDRSILVERSMGPQLVISATAAMKPASPTARHMDCARPLPAVSQKQDARCMRSLQSWATPA